MTYYKWLKKDRYAEYVDDFQYPEAGQWLPKVDRVKACRSGYHACREQDLLEWVNAELWEIESQSEWVECDNKVVTAGPVRLVRRVSTINDKTLRLFACDCAERAVEKYWITDGIRPEHVEAPMKAIETARLFVAGEATSAELAAAWTAAMAAARDAAWAAARAAAMAAARDAAWAAARAAAWADARDIDRQWQIDRLMQYVCWEVK